MSMALAHFAFGTALTVLAVTYLLPGVPYPRVVAMAGGGWAMVPDAHWVAPVGGDVLYAFHGSALANLFWFHRALDSLDPGDSKAVAAAMVALLLVATALAEHREYRALSRVREATGLDADD